MSDIEQMQLGELIEFQRGYDLPKSEFRSGNYPVQSSNGILGYHDEYKVIGPGITIGRSGTVGLPHFIESNYYPHNTTLFIKDFKGNNRRYIFYLLKNINLKDYKGGSGVPTMNRNHLHPLWILAHKNLQTQTQIAKVLSDLDAKIELNNKINTELEQMAKLLYDYWFVQFDFPISAEQAQAMGKPELKGKPYKSSGGNMVYKLELNRQIPEGWEVKELGEIAKTGSGGTPLKSKKEYYSNGTIPWINSGEVNEPFIIQARKFINEEGLKNSNAKIFQPKTILMAMYGATAGKVSFMDIEACTNQAICAIIPNNDFLRIYLKFGLEEMYQYLVNLSSGSARDNLSQDKIKSLNFILPDESIIIKFDETANLNYSKILNNYKQNQQLSELRDWLLPMLMNGQVSIKEAQEQLGMVAEDGVGYGG